MILKEMLKEITLRLPAGISEDDWIAYINSAIRQLGRYIGYEDAEIINGAEGINIYPLPRNINTQSIKGVTLCGKKLSPARFRDRMGDLSYALDPAGFIILPGKIKSGDEILILHNSCYEAKTFSQMSSDGKNKDDYENQDMGIDSEYADAVIFHALSGYCESCEDITAANNFRSQCNRVLYRAMQGRYQKRGRYPVTKEF